MSEHILTGLPPKCVAVEDISQFSSEGVLVLLVTHSYHGRLIHGVIVVIGASCTLKESILLQKNEE